MGSSLFPVITEHFENLVFDMAEQYPSLWLWYVHDTFAIWHLGFDNSQEFFITSIVGNLPSGIPWKQKLPAQFCFWFWCSSGKDVQWTPKSTENPHTHTHRPLFPFPIESPTTCEKRRVVQSLYHRSTTICKSAKTTLLELILWDMTCSLVPIPLGLLIQLSTDTREVIVWRRRFNHLVLYL